MIPRVFPSTLEGDTHVVGDLFHLVLLHEEHLGHLLAGALQDAGEQGEVAVTQLLLLCKARTTGLAPGLGGFGALTSRGLGHSNPGIWGIYSLLRGVGTLTFKGWGHSHPEVWGTHVQEFEAFTSRGWGHFCPGDFRRSLPGGLGHSHPEVWGTHVQGFRAPMSRGLGQSLIA